MLQNENKIQDIETLIKNKLKISSDEFKLVMEAMCRNIFCCSESSFILKSIDNEYEYEYNVPHKLIVKWGNNLDHEYALSVLSRDMDYNSSNYEWGILLCGKGIWLLNRDVKTTSAFFASRKIVFKILFSKKTDLAYLAFFNIDYLIGRNYDIYFFRDMITYKNTQFPSSKSNCWDVYWSCNKRFFAYYILKAGGKYTNNSSACYENIGLNIYESYIRKNMTIKTPNTAKNQFFYIKSFILNQAYNKYYDIGSGVILERCKDVLKERDNVINNTDADIKKIAYIIKYIENKRNGVRNKAIFLIILCFGLERRKICTLEWRDVDKKCNTLRIGEHNMQMPHILQKSMKALRAIKTSDARYIFGNSRTKWIKPMPEGGINDVLDCIKHIDDNDEFYNNFSPANIRKWLFRFLLKRRTPLQDVLVMMNVPICNIGNFIDNDELWEYSTFSINNSDNLNNIAGDSNYLLDDFMNRVEEIL